MGYHTVQKCASKLKMPVMSVTVSPIFPVGRDALIPPPNVLVFTIVSGTPNGLQTNVSGTPNGLQTYPAPQTDCKQTYPAPQTDCKQTYPAPQTDYKRIRHHKRITNVSGTTTGLQTYSAPQTNCKHILHHKRITHKQHNRTLFIQKYTR